MVVSKGGRVTHRIKIYVTDSRAKTALSPKSWKPAALTVCVGIQIKYTRLVSNPVQTTLGVGS